MGGSAGAAPTPDANVGEFAKKQAELASQWLDFGKQSFATSNTRQAELDALTKRVQEQQLGLATDQAGWARADRSRYETTFKPVEDQLVAEATNYSTPERQAEAAAEAKADVGMAAANAKAASERAAAGMGINPTSGRFAGIERSGELSTALATAGAQNNARQIVRDKGLALKAEVAGLGQGLTAQAGQLSSLSGSLGSSAVGLGQGAQSSYLNNAGMMGNTYAGVASGFGNAANTLNGQFANQMASYNANQASDNAGWNAVGSAVGLGAGLIFGSSKNIKEDMEEIPEGAALEAVEAMPVETWRYKDGEGDGEAHIGPYADEFAAATGKGDGETINAIDAIGVTMGAVQDLATKVEKIAAAIGLGGGKVTPMKKKMAPQRAVAEPEPAEEELPPPPAAEPVGLGMRRAA